MLLRRKPAESTRWSSSRRRWRPACRADAVLGRRARPWRDIPRDAGSLAAVLYIGLFASLLAFILWNRCVATLGATVTGISFHLVALFTAALAFPVLGEPVRPFHLIGIALILAGFVLATDA